MNVGLVSPLYGVYAFFVLVGGAAALVALLPPGTLTLQIRESIIALFGEERLQEAVAAVTVARQQTDISNAQKNLLRVIGPILGLGVFLLFLFFVPVWWYAAVLGGLIGVLGLLWPDVVWKGNVSRRVAQGVYNDIPDFVSFLRLNIGAGRSLKEVLDTYVADSRDEAVLAAEIRQVLYLAEGGANLFDQLEQAAARLPEGDLLQVSIALRQVEEASDPQAVLQALYELIRAVRIAERKKQIKARVLTAIAVGVLFLMPALFALILVPALVTFNNLGVF